MNGVASHSPAKKARIYIVDDHELVRMGLEALIRESAEFEVCGQADNYEQALKEIVLLAPDIAVIDLSLKGGSGLELIRYIHKENRRIRMCAFSVHEELAYAHRVIRAGASGYLMKGETPERVLSVIRLVASGQKAVSDRVIATFLDPMSGKLNDDQELTDRELEIMSLYGNGESTRQIASRLKISLKAVEAHRTKIRRKFNLNSGAEVIQFCVQWAKRQGPTDTA